MEFNKFIFLMSVVCFAGYSESLGMMAEDPIVCCGYVSTKGHRKNQRDAVVNSAFTINGINYDMAMVCDGCGKDNFAVRYVKDNMTKILQTTLMNNDTRYALSWAFKYCEDEILKKQDNALNASGVRIFLSLWDLTNKQEYQAQLGDCRLYKLNSSGKILYGTTDHKPSDKKEKEYIESCGGQVRCNGTFVGLSSDNGSYGLTTSRALGCAHLKQGQKGVDHVKRGPVNAVPSICQLDMQKGEIIEMLVTSGYTKIVDLFTIEKIMEDLLHNAFFLSSEEFYNKYKWDNNSFQCTLNEIDKQGNDAWSNIGAKIIYALSSYHKMDNVTILLRSWG